MRVKQGLGFIVLDEDPDPDKLGMIYIFGSIINIKYTYQIGDQYGDNQRISHAVGRGHAADHGKSLPVLFSSS